MYVGQPIVPLRARSFRTEVLQEDAGGQGFVRTEPSHGNLIPLPFAAASKTLMVYAAGWPLRTPELRLALPAIPRRLQDSGHWTSYRPRSSTRHWLDD